jgi:hypothetical protein
MGDGVTGSAAIHSGIEFIQIRLASWLALFIEQSSSQLQFRFPGCVES